MQIERIRVLWLAFLVAAVTVSCDAELDAGASSQPVPAPASVAGLTYDATISSGSGLFRTEGLFRFEFDTNTYVLYGNGIFNPFPPFATEYTGTYTYTVSADDLVGTVVTTIDGSPTRFFTYEFSYLGSTFHGTFDFTAEGGGNPVPGSQVGDFVERPR
jgi:hypothetical protein